MIKNKYIRNITAVWLLAIFALSNTPVKVLHHLFANHIDQQTILHYGNEQPQLQIAGIDCHVETNVVINPYICEAGIRITGIEPSFAAYTIIQKDEFHFTRLVYFELRGPPSVV
ncbi:MAG: hypothetical protein ABIW47_15840 [Ginsengibacter sp.]